ncbi:hypothetical protein EHS25_004761 [Saitozyma podzolica]|uniref:DUF4116 domain-containing protein n=1 Tax=Saitozyma podzolica TaxID=1890683 RepID=A0A427Y323_9TREE|nr:hypothetical protein EHS25_004761 [Saitozyma podzolica]
MPAAERRMLLGLWEGRFDLMEAIRAFPTNRKVVYAVPEANGNGLRYASAELQEDQDVITAVMKQESSALVHASQALRGDEIVVMKSRGSGREGQP